VVVTQVEGEQLEPIEYMEALRVGQARLSIDPMENGVDLGEYFSWNLLDVSASGDDGEAGGTGRWDRIGRGLDQRAGPVLTALIDAVYSVLQVGGIPLADLGANGVCTFIKAGARGGAGFYAWIRGDTRPSAALYGDRPLVISLDQEVLESQDSEHGVEPHAGEWTAQEGDETLDDTFEPVDVVDSAVADELRTQLADAHGRTRAIRPITRPGIRLFVRKLYQ